MAVAASASHETLPEVTLSPDGKVLTDDNDKVHRFTRSKTRDKQSTLTICKDKEFEIKYDRVDFGITAKNKGYLRITA